MAEYLIAHSDEENTFPNIGRIADSMSQHDDEVSTSNSADDSPLPVKKTGKRAVRGLRNKVILPLNDQILSKNSVYSSRVTQSWQAFNAGQVENTVSDDDSGTDEELTSLFATKNTKARKRNKKKLKLKDYEPVINLDDEPDVIPCTPESVASTSIIRDKSPTPPPTPNKDLRPSKKKKQPKGVKKAYNNLRKAEKLELCVEDDPDLLIVDETPPTPSQETPRKMVVKVRSRSGIQRFPMKKTESFGHVMKDMAEQEYVSLSRVVMVFNDTTIRPHDTPESLSIGVADIIECHIRNNEDNMSSNRSTDEEDDDLEDPSIIQLKVQGKDPKSRIVMKVHKTESLGELMRHFAYKRDVDVASLKFEFDGDEITEVDTPEELGLEDDFCIDVIGI